MNHYYDFGLIAKKNNVTIFMWKEALNNTQSFNPFHTQLNNHILTKNE